MGVGINQSINRTARFGAKFNMHHYVPNNGTHYLVGTVEKKDIPLLNDIFNRTRDSWNRIAPTIAAGDSVIIGGAIEDVDNGRNRRTFDLRVIPKQAWEAFKQERANDYLDHLYRPLPSGQFVNLINSTHVYELLYAEQGDTYSSRGTHEARQKLFEQSTFPKPDITSKTVPAFDSDFYDSDKTVTLTKEIIGNEFFKLKRT